jgi:hypothetical protein
MAVQIIEFYTTYTQVVRKSVDLGFGRLSLNMFLAGERFKNVKFCWISNFTTKGIVLIF